MNWIKETNCSLFNNVKEFLDSRDDDCELECLDNTKIDCFRCYIFFLEDRLETALEKVRQYEMLIENKEK
jgi:hypothetical protein